jgi:hypothetical protein
MPLFRLIGLALFITAIFLALAAAITKTTHIRIQLPGTNNATQPPGPAGVLPPPIEPGFGSEPPQPEAKAIQFTSVPIVWPLTVAAGMGLLMWFMLPSETLRTSRSPKRRSRRQR